MVVNRPFVLFSMILSLFAIGNAGFAFADTVDVVEQKLVILQGEGFDPDGNDLTFEWRQIDGEPVQLSSYTAMNPEFMAPVVDNGFIKVLTFELTVTDPLGESDTDIVEIVVNPVNQAPIVDAGQDQVAFENLNVLTLVGNALDPDEDELTFTWEQLSGQEVELSEIHRRYLTLFPTEFDYTQTDPLIFRLTAEDGFGGVGSDTVAVYPFTGIPSNELIWVDAGPMQTVREGEVVTLSATGETKSGLPIDYTWAQVLGPTVSLSAYNQQNVQFIAPQLPDDVELILSFQVTGYSPGSGYASDLAIVKVIPSNGPPIADAGPDQTVGENVVVRLEGTGTDPDNDRLRFSWSQKSGLPIELFERTTASVYFISPQINTDAEELVFELTVTDTQGNSDTDDAMVTIARINFPPSAFAGPDRRVISGSEVTITGVGSDPENEPITYAWRQISGEVVEFDGTQAAFTFTAPIVEPGESKRLMFQLKVTDSVDQSAFDQVVVIVVPENSPPIVDAGPDQIVDEGTLTSIACTGVDPDGDPVTFAWTASSDRVNIANPSSAQTTVQLPNVVADEQIVMTCSVSDGRLTGSDTMTITVRNVLSLDIVADAGPDRIVNENVRISLDGTGSYDPENQPIYYEWTQLSGEPVILSDVTSVTPSFTTPTVANFEIKVLEFELRVYDDNGREDTDTVMITVDPVNAPPEAKASAIQP